LTGTGSPKKASSGSGLEDLLLAQIRAVGLPEPERQARLVPGRKFLWDFAWREHGLACEVQGGIFLPKGAHTSGVGVTRDCEKAALALLEGFVTLAVTGEHVRSGQALAWIEALLIRIGRRSGPRTPGGAGCESVAKKPQESVS
jgi:hypothetical protein